jgi:hypothetical protein
MAVSGACGGGTISVTTDADGANVARIAVVGLQAEDSEGVRKTLTGTANFPADVVPIAEDATFSAYFEVLASEIQLAGTFGDGSLTGALDIVPGTCGTLAYSAAAATAVPTALPSTGSGPNGGGSNVSWTVAGVAMALLGLSAALVLLFRKPS